MNDFDLKALQDKKLPRCGAMDLFTAQDAAAEADAKKHLDPYLAQFARPVSGNMCVGCGRKLTGFFGTFSWGLAHGEGHCSACGYPTRFFHRFDDGPVQRLNMPLQYHPEDLERREPVAEATETA